MLLLPATLLIQCGAEGLVGPARRLAEMLPAPLIVASRDPIRLNRPLLRLDVDKPRPAELRGLWGRALGAGGPPLQRHARSPCRAISPQRPHRVFDGRRGRSRHRVGWARRAVERLPIAGRDRDLTILRTHRSADQSDDLILPSCRK